VIGLGFVLEERETGQWEGLSQKTSASSEKFLIEATPMMAIEWLIALDSQHLCPNDMDDVAFAVDFCAVVPDRNLLDLSVFRHPSVSFYYCKYFTFKAVVSPIFA
jgi:hypothetical protein